MPFADHASVAAPWPLALLLAAMPVAAQAPRPDIAPAARPAGELIHVPGFGPLHVFRPAGRPTGFALFASGDGGWNPGMVDMTGEMVKQGFTVAGFSTPEYLGTLGGRNNACAYPAGDFETLAHDLERRDGFADYATPLLVGYSSGAALAYGALAQSPAGTFAGAVSLGFCPELALHKPLCAGRALHSDPRPRGGGVALYPAPQLEDPWVVLQGDSDVACARAVVTRFVAGSSPAQLIVLPGITHEFAGHDQWFPHFREALDGFAGRPPGTATPPTPGPAARSVSAIADLPLAEVPARAGSSSVVALIYTGDGGWRKFDREVIDALAKRGIAGVGWDSLKYFWSRRTPNEAAMDLARTMRHYRTAWRKTRVLLIGYSFGADALPLILPELPAAERSTITLVALLAPGQHGSLEFHVSDWLGGGSYPESGPLAPAILALAPTRVVCIFGAEDRRSACNGLRARHVKVVELPGDHHFNGDTGRVADEIHAAL